MRLTSEAIADQWKRVGVVLELRPLEFGDVLYGHHEGEFSDVFVAMGGREQGSGYFRVCV